MTALLQIIRSPLLIFRAVRYFLLSKAPGREILLPPVRFVLFQTDTGQPGFKADVTAQCDNLSADLFDHLPQYVRSDMGQLTVSDDRIRARPV